MKTLSDYFELMLERPKKFTPEDVDFIKAPEGSALRCGVCVNYYRRATDGHEVCQIMRDDATDNNGVPPDWRCRFFTVTGDVFPLLEDGPEHDSDDDGKEGNEEPS